MAKPRREDEHPEERPAKPLPPRLSRSTGYRRDPVDVRDYKARALFGARRGLPTESLQLEACVLGIKDQGATESCVGQAIGTAIDARLRKMGRTDVPQASSQAIYALARALEREDPNSPLLDQGSYPRLAMRALREWGVPSEQRWPFDPAKINAELPWDVLREASAARVQAWWRIDSAGKERVEDACQALAAGYPVVFGAEVDRAFLDYGGEATKFPVKAIDPKESVGGHMMCLVGYTTRNGSRLLRGVNSWGLSWGDRGSYWAAESFVMLPSASDFYVIQVG